MVGWVKGSGCRFQGLGISVALRFWGSGSVFQNLGLEVREFGVEALDTVGLGGVGLRV